MKGRRVADDAEPMTLEPGDYSVQARRVNDLATVLNVWVRLPGEGAGHGPVNLTKWSPVIEDDGTLTLSPSILAHAHETLDPTTEERVTIPEWHGYLERGEWRQI